MAREHFIACSSVLVVSTLAMLGEPAVAQTAESIARQAVRDRVRPGYETDGVPVGAFVARPVFAIGEKYIDNIYATADDETSDAVTAIDATGSIESLWSVHSLGAYWDLGYNAFADNSDENFLDATAGARGRLDFGVSTAADLDASYASLHEPRTSSNSPANVLEPITYTVAAADARIGHTFDQLELTAGAGYREYSYDDAPLAGGAVLDQNFRDRQQITAIARGEYRFSERTWWFAEIEGNQRDYDLAPPDVLIDRSSEGYQALIGAGFDFTQLITGEAAIGYFRQDFDAVIPGSDGSVEGMDARANINWFMTPLTNVQLLVARDVSESSLAGSVGYVSTAGSFIIDHDLATNIILSGRLDYNVDDYQQVDRNDDRFGVGLGATYLLDDHFGVELQATHIEQDSSGDASGTEFDINELSVRLRAAL